MDINHVKEQTCLPGEWREVKIECPHCSSDQFVYLYDDDKTCYCCQCDEEFDTGDIYSEIDLGKHAADSQEDREIQMKLNELVSDDPEVVKVMADRIIDSGQKQLPAYQHKPTTYENWRGQGYTSFTTNACTHTPQHIIAGEGWGVWAGKKEDCKRFARQFDVVLNLTFTSIKEPHIIPIPELEEFAEIDCNYKEIQLDWPDYGVINMPREFWVKLLKYLEENKLRLLVFCLGGHGRTGTALAVMMGLALNYTPEQAINWVKRHYCSSAIETLGQEEYVRRILRVEAEVEVEVKSNAAKAGE